MRTRKTFSNERNKPSTNILTKPTAILSESLSPNTWKKQTTSNKHSEMILMRAKHQRTCKRAPENCITPKRETEVHLLSSESQKPVCFSKNTTASNSTRHLTCTQNCTQSTFCCSKLGEPHQGQKHRIFRTNRKTKPSGRFDCTMDSP